MGASLEIKSSKNIKNYLLEWYRDILKVWKSSYLKNLSITGLGVGLGSVISLVTSPIISRIFSPEAYGIAGLYANILSYLALAGSLMLPTGIVVIQNPRKLYRLLAGLKVLWILTFLLSILLVILIYPFLSGWLDYPSIRIWIWLLPFGLLASQIGSVIEALNVRGSQFGLNVKINLTNSIIGRAITIIGGWSTGGHYLAIILSSFIGVFVAVCGQAKSAVLRWWRIKPSWRALKQSVKEFAYYPLYMLPGNVIGLLALSAPFLVFSFLYSPALGGVYLFTENILAAPFRLASKAITPVYLQKISTLFHSSPRAFRQLTITTNFALFGAGLFPYAILTVWAPEIFTYVFGAEWWEGGVMAQYLSFAILFRMSSSPLSGVYRVAMAEKMSLLTQIVMFFTRTIPLAVGLIWFTFYQALLMFAIGSLMGYLFHFYQLCKLGSLPFFKSVGIQFLIFGAMCLLLVIGKSFF
ncbi:oligosaccharide flippase family protein [Lewinella cohaerens]|uniref:oligosaccharide flippase family protein n=1 Tax=Lewinella cohaerens TaxID=70995 RepID=UPI0003608105|nr:oligosaccharide flippase family protein [Lewinella cohaerens]